ncbi:hypothetical protein QTN25_001376 [Entamoeba marina]
MFIIRLQLLMFDNQISTDLEITTRGMLNKLKLPRFRTRIDEYYLRRMYANLIKNKFSVKQIETVIENTIRSIQFAVSEQKEELLKKEKEDKRNRDIDENEFVEELNDSINECMNENDAVSVSTYDSSLKLDIRRIDTINNPEEFCLLVEKPGSKNNEIISSVKPKQKKEKHKESTTKKRVVKTIVPLD